MEIEKDLQALLQFACNLLTCSAAGLFLRGSEHAVRHPLLAFLPSHLACFASCDDSFLFCDESMLARFEMALTDGQITYLDALPGSQYLSIALVPLNHPSGLLGLLILVDPRAQAFLTGERLLLSQFSPLFAQKLEQLLSDFCLASPPSQVLLTTAHEPATFFSMISHELRVPLTAIKGYAGLLQAYGPSASSSENASPASVATPLPAALQQQYLQRILEQIDHLEVLLSDLLDVSRLQSGRLSLHPHRIDIAPLCQQMMLLIQNRVEQQQPDLYTFSCRCSSPLIALADAARLQQVLVNLLENAVKYSPAGGTIDLVASLQPPSADNAVPLICVTVRDHGVGIPLHQQAHLFRPFSRAATPLHVDGSGLGLYISRLLIEAMGGTILLQSSEGSGTQVTFFLPACVE
jgi:signal transduction histidine kinase